MRRTCRLAVAALLCLSCPSLAAASTGPENWLGHARRSGAVWFSAPPSPGAKQARRLPVRGVPAPLHWTSRAAPPIG